MIDTLSYCIYLIRYQFISVLILLVMLNFIEWFIHNLIPVILPFMIRCIYLPVFFISKHNKQLLKYSNPGTYSYKVF